MVELELSARAGELVDTLREGAAASEAARRIPAETARLLARAGMFRMLVPTSYGGLETPPDQMVRTIATLARGDAAAAWCVMTGATTSLMSAYLRPETAASIWSHHTLITAGVFAPQGRAVPCDGGYRLSGRWHFASGCDNASWMMGGALVFDGDRPRERNGRPEILSAFFPADQARIIDTWDVAGLCGTGSHDIAVDDLEVPAEHTAFVMHDAPHCQGTLYRFPIFGLLAAGVAAVGLGIARATIDDFAALASRKKGFGRRRSLADQDLVQLEVAKAEGELRAAEALLLSSCRDAWLHAEQGELELSDRALLRLAACQAVRGCVRAVDAMYHAGGGTALYRKSPLQRHLRDIHTLTQHLMVSSGTLKTTGRVLLGVETDASQL
jgi:alkylation response protein AidB-like acyl-CoA dehydrogenase